MGQYDFTYELPSNFNNTLIQFLRQNRREDVAQAFQRSKYEYDDVGLAYYAGLRGDNWNKIKSIKSFSTIGTRHLFNT